MYIALLAKCHDHLHNANSVMRVKCFILNFVNEQGLWCMAILYFMIEMVDFKDFPV
jgi:hypothetical protein